MTKQEIILLLTQLKNRNDVELSKLVDDVLTYVDNVTDEMSDSFDVIKEVNEATPLNVIINGLKLIKKIIKIIK